ELKVCKVDVDENPELAQLFNVMSIPTLAAFKDGQLSGTAVGYQSKENVLKLFA
ncbi:MAG: thiol reductase thioredoxin, partial [Acidaminococcaceae bacterium]|nr:thiol reductase thioredoxin [Acidaminococcaceae bacterium]